MSARNGDKAHHSINRKRSIARRVKTRAMLKASKEKAAGGQAEASQAAKKGDNSQGPTTNSQGA